MYYKLIFIFQSFQVSIIVLQVVIKVVFGCSSEENKNEEDDVQQQQNLQKGQDDDRLSIKSDDSYEYVNVIAFASSEDLGSDLSEFVKEVRLAPDNLHSFAPDNTDTINKQVILFL